MKKMRMLWILSAIIGLFPFSFALGACGFPDYSNPRDLHIIEDLVRLENRPMAITKKIIILKKFSVEGIVFEEGTLFTNQKIEIFPYVQKGLVTNLAIFQFVADDFFGYDSLGYTTLRIFHKDTHELITELACLE